MPDAAQALWQAGTATEIVTPDEPQWLAGYAARTEPAKGKISHLEASAMALRDADGGMVVIASIDLIAITQIIAQRVYAAVQAATGLPRERLILAATHTHYAPEFRPDKTLFFKIPRQYAEKIVPTAQKMADALARVIIAATKNLQPVTLHATRTSASFAHNRRREGVKGGNPSKADVLDQDVPVLWVLSQADRRPVSVVFGYACHNTTLPPEDCRYCADWAGFAKQALRDAMGDVTPLFITGCGADQNPEPRGSLELSRQYGAELAGAVHATLASPGSTVNGPLRVAMTDVPLALEPVKPQELQSALTCDDPPRRVKARFLLDQIDRGERLITEYPAPMQVIGFGHDLLMIVMSGEIVVDWAHKFKAAFADQAAMVWVAGYCNDMFGYIPTRRIQQEGGYEGGRANLWSWVPAPWTADVEERVTRGVKDLVEGLMRNR
jgi:hypothetical protein